MVPTAEPGIPWQYIGHLQTTDSPADKHVSQRGLFDILKKKDISKQPASIVGMFARLSCAENVASVFEPPDGHYLELEQVAVVCFSTHTPIFLHIHYRFIHNLLLSLTAIPTIPALVLLAHHPHLARLASLLTTNLY